jgi:hypothetical protein
MAVSKTTKRTLLSGIKRLSKQATASRLAGKIQDAMQKEAIVNGLVRRAESDGWGEEAYEAERSGAAAASGGKRRDPRYNLED